MFLSSTGATEATEALIDLESVITDVKELMDGFDPANLLPNIDSIVGKVQLICTLAILIAPVIMLVLGLAYLFLSPKEANYYFGYRTTFGMGSVSAWRRTQRFAGLTFLALGLALTILMLLIAMTLGGREAMDMVSLSVKCLLWQGGLGLVAIAFINGSAAYTFDYNGNRRRKKKAKKHA